MMRGATDATFAGEEAVTRYGDAQRRATNLIDDGMNALNRSKNTIEGIERAAQAAAGAMGEYFSVFDQKMSDVETVDKIQEAFNDHLVDLALSGELSSEQLSGLMDTLKEMDPVAAKALETSLAISTGLDAMTAAAMETGDWDIFLEGMEYIEGLEPTAIKTPLESGAEGIRALGLAAKEEQEAISIFMKGLDEGLFPVEAMAPALNAVGVEGPAALGVMGKLIEDIEGTHAPADGLLERLGLLVAQPWKVQVEVTYNDPGMPNMNQYLAGLPGGVQGPRPIPDKPSRRAAGGPVNAFEPYWVGESGPELIVPRGSGNVIPNDKVGTTIIYNYKIINQNPETAAMNAAIIQSREMEQLRNH